MNQLERRFFRFLANVLHFIAEQINPGKPPLASLTFTTEGVAHMGDITVNSDTSDLVATVNYLDANGNPTMPADVPVWASSDESVATVTAAEDGMTASVTPLPVSGPGGSATIISVVAHDDDGEEVRAEGTVTVQPGDATIAEITFSESGASTDDETTEPPVVNPL